MKSLFCIAVLLFVFGVVVEGHMGITFPAPRTGGRASWDLDSLRYPNPGEGICHGLNTPESVKATLEAGSSFTIKMGFGAAHDGGHCVALVSYDGQTWVKIGETKDCTLKGSMTFTVPREVQNCDRCTLAWAWTPKSSGACEIYMVCTDVSITGGSGAGTLPIAWTRPEEGSNAWKHCKRVGDNKCTTHFGPYLRGGECDDGSNPMPEPEEPEVPPPPPPPQPEEPQFPEGPEVPPPPPPPPPPQPEEPQFPEEPEVPQPPPPQQPPSNNGQREGFCRGKATGRYCISDSTFYWCYSEGQVDPAVQSCPGGLTCSCGFTATLNPCNWPGADKFPSDCT